MISHVCIIIIYHIIIIWKTGMFMNVHHEHDCASLYGNSLKLGSVMLQVSPVSMNYTSTVIPKKIKRGENSLFQQGFTDLLVDNSV